MRPKFRTRGLTWRVCQNENCGESSGDPNTARFHRVHV